MSESKTLPNGTTLLTLDDGRNTSALNVIEIEGEVEKILPSGKTIINLPGNKQTMATNVYNLGGGSGGGAVDSVNGQTGTVILDGEDIEATVGGTEDTIQNHLQSLRNDLGDLADDVAEKTEKNVITLTGESGTLTSTQITQVLDDAAVLEIVCDGQVFRLANKDSTLTYRTYINSDCALNENVAFKAIYVQLNSGAANYGSWSLEEVSAGGGNVIDDSTTSTTTTWSSDKLNTMIGNVETLINAL